MIFSHQKRPAHPERILVGLESGDKTNTIHTKDAKGAKGSFRLTYSLSFMSLQHFIALNWLRPKAS